MKFNDEVIKMVISFYNAKTGCRFKYTEANIAMCRDALEEVDETQDAIIAFKDFIRTYGNDFDKYENLTSLCAGFKEEQIRARMAKAEEIKKEAQKDENKLDISLKFMSDLINQMLGNVKVNEIQDTVIRDSKELLKQFIFEEYGPIQKKISLDLGERKVELKGVLHKKFDEVLAFVNANEPVFLTGAAGTGKNVLCKQIAEALGLDFYFSNAVTQEYKITGFTDAAGIFHETQFYKAFKNGGLFMLDEMDASIPEVLIILNAAIANRYMDFPAPIGFVKAHENFRLIAAGNTFGNGADYDYVGRSQLDAASLDRFAMVRIDYDERIEESCAQGNKELLSFCRKFRKATQKAGIRTVVSYRSITRLAKLDAYMDTAELLDTCLIKSLELDNLNSIKADLSRCGKYTDALYKIIENRKNQ